MIRIQNEGFRLKKKMYAAVLEKISRQLKLKGSVTIRIAGEAEIRKLNKKYRHHDRATDVLSFPLAEKLPDGFYAGDVMICWPVAKKQAKENGQTLAKELLLLMIHGLLHLRGYDHEKDHGEMLARQNRLFALYGGEVP